MIRSDESESPDEGRGERQALLLAASRGLGGFEDRRSVVEQIVRGAVHAVPGVVRAGVSLRDRDGSTGTVAPSDGAVAAVDAAQAELGEGPCVAAIDESPVVSVPDLADHGDRWPQFVGRARDHGIVATLAFRLFTTTRTLGALNLHADTVGAFGDEAHELGELFAGYAALALAGASRSEDFQRALETRDDIGQAKGVLMNRHQVDAQQAFAMLVRASQNTNAKLHDVARRVVHESGRREGGGRRR